MNNYLNPIPAIDLVDGRVVRLVNGDYNKEIQYSENPLDMAKKYSDMWFQNIHIIDLDGAKKKSPQNMGVVEKILSQTDLNVQVWGWIRTQEDIQNYIQLGVDRIILSSQAVKDVSFWRKSVEKHWKERFILSLDVLDGLVKINGWLEWSWLSIDGVIENIGSENIQNIIVTDISKDGTMSGVNIDLYKELMDRYQEINIIPAWGVSHVRDIEGLKNIWIKEVVVGRAIYEDSSFLDSLVNNTKW